MLYDYMDSRTRLKTSQKFGQRQRTVELVQMKKRRSNKRDFQIKPKDEHYLLKTTNEALIQLSVLSS